MDSTAFPPEHMAPMVSIVVVCRNRLAHLQQTLPAMLRQSASEVIVVDYGCEQGTHAWVRAHHPQARTVQVTDDPGFCLARGRNQGAAIARGRLLLFADADIRLRADLAGWGAAQARRGDFYTLDPSKDPTLCGTVLLAQADFRRVGGYDEVFRTWGWEDADLYLRLGELGLQRRYLPADIARAIPHGNELRQLGPARPRAAALVVGRLYAHAKRDHHRLHGQPMGREGREVLMQKLWEAAESLVAGREEEIRVTLPLRRERGRAFASELLLHYTLRRRDLLGAGAEEAPTSQASC